LVKLQRFFIKRREEIMKKLKKLGLNLLVVCVIGLTFAGCASSSAFYAPTNPFYYASSGDLDGLKKLIAQKKVSLDMTDKKRFPSTLFTTAIKYNQFNIADYLLQEGVDINEAVNSMIYTKSRAPLHCAAKDGNLAGVQYLLKNGATIDVYDLKKTTPLMFAAKSNEFEVVKFLVESGSDVNAKSRHKLYKSVVSSARKKEIKDYLKSMQNI